MDVRDVMEEVKNLKRFVQIVEALKKIVRIQLMPTGQIKVVLVLFLEVILRVTFIDWEKLGLGGQIPVTVFLLFLIM
jgi:hypothetical protein